MVDPTNVTLTKAKNLAVFLDGTWDTVGDNTNVWRIKSLCADKGADGQPQLNYYSVGVGTSIGEKVRGGVLGYGVDRVVRDAYQWLIENYDEDEGDNLFLFGFSRGAFDAWNPGYPPCPIFKDRRLGIAPDRRSSLVQTGFR